MILAVGVKFTHVGNNIWNLYFPSWVKVKEVKGLSNILQRLLNKPSKILFPHDLQNVLTNFGTNKYVVLFKINLYWNNSSTSSSSYNPLQWDTYWNIDLPPHYVTLDWWMKGSRCWLHLQKNLYTPFHAKDFRMIPLPGRSKILLSIYFSGLKFFSITVL